MVQQPVDRGGGGHRVLEDLFPLTEHQIARDEHGTALVAFGHAREEHLDLFGALLHVADVVENQELEDVEAAKRVGQREVSLCREKLLNELEGRSEQDGVTFENERVGESARRMCFARALLSETRRKPRVSKRLERLSGWESCSSQKPFNAPFATVAGFEFEDLEHQRQDVSLPSLLETGHEFGVERWTLPPRRKGADGPAWLLRNKNYFEVASRRSCAPCG